ncbi:hypothetical protein ABZ614_11395 [Streptomyces sp. NPDC013178]|uniref:hypothetical protein n=1 Tax=Streptomyces sp. NPDC013178 TaxID=3155118 RepID=UPI0033C76A53
MNTAMLPALLCCVWIGAVITISFLEAPLKFRASGITLPLGLAVGRVVFQALNRLEATLLLVAAVLAVPVGSEALVLLPAAAILSTQMLVLRPRLDRRAQRLIDGLTVSRSPLHLLYVAGEVLKLVALVTATLVLGGAK